MSRNFELDIFRVIQRRQRLFIKLAAISLALCAALFLLSIGFRWPLFFAVIPLALTGPFIMSVVTARCPHCQRPLHRSVLGVLRSLDRCARCGFPGR
jgi:hypothetical protein